MVKEKNILKIIYINLILMMIITGSSSCFSAGPPDNKRLLAMGQNQGTPRSGESGQGVFVDDFLKNVSAASSGQDLVVKGEFMGWQGPCNYPPPETRSDWMLSHNGKCIYVTGPVPMNFDSKRNSPDIGKEVEVRGEIRFDKKNRPYLKVISRTEGANAK